MTTDVYTTGYGGKKPADVLAIITAVNCDLFDIRFSARSRNPQWALSNMIAFFGEERYTHVKALGNKNYRGSYEASEIVDYETGRDLIVASERPVLLLCMCKAPDKCHRRLLAQMLIADGFNVQEWGNPNFAFADDVGEPDSGQQLGLFGG